MSSELEERAAAEREARNLRSIKAGLPEISREPVAFAEAEKLERLVKKLSVGESWPP